MHVIHQKNTKFSKASQERTQNVGAEINRYRGGKNLMIADSSLVKKQKLEFEEKKDELSCSDIAAILNQCPLYDIVMYVGFSLIKVKRN